MRQFRFVIVLSLFYRYSLCHPKAESSVNPPVQHGSRYLLNIVSSNSSINRPARCTPCGSDRFDKRPVSNHLNPEYRGNGADNLGYDWSPMAWGSLAFPHRSKMPMGGMRDRNGRQMSTNWYQNKGDSRVICDTCRIYEENLGGGSGGKPHQGQMPYGYGGQDYFKRPPGYYKNGRTMTPQEYETKVSSQALGVLIKPGSRIAYIPSRSGEMYWDGVSGGGTRWDGFSNGISWIGNRVPEWDRMGFAPREDKTGYNPGSSELDKNRPYSPNQPWNSPTGNSGWDRGKDYYFSNGSPNQIDPQWRDTGYASNWHYGSTNQNGWNGNSMKWNFGGKEWNDNDRAANRFYFNTQDGGNTRPGERENQLQYGNQYPNYQPSNQYPNFRPRPSWRPDGGYRINDRDPSSFSQRPYDSGDRSRPWDYNSRDPFGYERPRPGPAPGGKYPMMDRNDYNLPWNKNPNYDSSKPGGESNFPYGGNRYPGEGGNSRPNYSNGGPLLFYPNDGSQQPSYPNRDPLSGGVRPTYPSGGSGSGSYPGAENQIGTYPGDVSRPIGYPNGGKHPATGGRPPGGGSLGGYPGGGNYPGSEISGSGYPIKGSYPGGHPGSGSSGSYPGGYPSGGSSGSYPSGGSSPGGYPGSGSSNYPSGGSSTGGYPGSGSSNYPSGGSSTGGYPGSGSSYPGGGSSTGGYPGGGISSYPSGGSSTGGYPGGGGSSSYPSGGSSTGGYPESGSGSSYPSGGSFPGGYLGGGSSGSYPGGGSFPGGYPSGGSGGSYPGGGSSPGGFPGGGSGSSYPDGGNKSGKYPVRGGSWNYPNRGTSGSPFGYPGNEPSEGHPNKGSRPFNYLEPGTRPSGGGGGSYPVIGGGHPAGYPGAGNQPGNYPGGVNRPTYPESESLIGGGQRPGGYTDNVVPSYLGNKGRPYPGDRPSYFGFGRPNEYPEHPGMSGYPSGGNLPGDHLGQGGRPGYLGNPQGNKNPPKGYYTGYITEIGPDQGSSQYGGAYPNQFGGSYPGNKNTYPTKDKNQNFYGGDDSNRYPSGDKNVYPSYSGDRYPGGGGGGGGGSYPVYNRDGDRFYYGQGDMKGKYPNGFPSNHRYPDPGNFDGNSSSSSDKNTWNYGQDERKDGIYRRSGGSYPPYRGGQYFTSSYLATMSTTTGSTQEGSETKTQSVTKTDEVTQPTK